MSGQHDEADPKACAAYDSAPYQSASRYDGSMEAPGRTLLGHFRTGNHTAISPGPRCDHA